MYAGCYTRGYPFQQFVDYQRWAGAVHGDRRRWIELPIMGLVFAMVYQIPLIVLAWHHPFTCLPMTSPTPANNLQSATLGVACIGNQDHFAVVRLQTSLFITYSCFSYIYICQYSNSNFPFSQIWLRPNAPLPPPPLEWVEHHHPSVEGWDAPFQAQIQRFRALRADVGRPLLFSQIVFHNFIKLMNVNLFFRSL